MTSAPSSLGYTKEQFADAWNSAWTDPTLKGNKITGWTPLGESNGFQTYGAVTAGLGDEHLIFVLEASDGTMQAAGFQAVPSGADPNGLGASPLLTGYFIQNFAARFTREGDADLLLNKLGLFFPLASYKKLDGVNACTEFEDGFYARLVSFDDKKGDANYLLYLRAAD